jgi:alpha-tubulin suppressor-like RCC1 family protein
MQTNITHDGIAAQSGAISNSQTATVQTTLSGPGIVSFWWKISSETNRDLLFATVNGSTQAVISGQVDWQPRTVYVGSGAQVVQWTYAKDGSRTAGQDAAWLDQVTFSPGSVAPIITIQPANVSPGAGMNAAISVTAVGTPPLNYQWLFNGQILPGATSSSIVISNAQVSNVGLYSVIVTNQAGTNYSSNATLRLAEVLSWGVNANGQTNVPADLTSVAAIAGGWHHSMALKNNGTVIVWGANDRGQTNVPAGLSNVVAIASRSGDQCMALRADGTVVVWGDNSFGLTNVPPGLSNVIAISASGSRCLALRSDGTAVSWGSSQGIPSGFTNLIAVSAGDFASLFLRADGTVAATGAIVPPNVTNIIAIAAGGGHNLALKADGTVIGWGDNGSGQISIPAGLSNVVAIAAGDYHSLALRKDGTVVVWGRYFAGRFLVPTVPAGLANVVAIAAGSDHDLVLLKNSSPPFITEQPTNQTIVVGNPATFTVAAGPTTLSLSFQWRFNDTNDIRDATNSSLTLSNVQSADAGLYSVLITNSSGSILSSNALLSVDHPPLADANATLSFVISTNGSNAVVVLDGSRSSDYDGDMLQYVWLSTLSSQSSILATEVLAGVVLAVGEHSITLVVSDGLAANTNRISLTVLTITQAVEQLKSLVNQAGIDHTRGLTTILEAAMASLHRGNPTATANELMAFQKKVIAQIAPSDSALARILIAAAQKAVDALQVDRSGTHAPKLEEVKSQLDGKVQLRFSSTAGRTHVVETSTNLLYWEIIGAALERGAGTFEFEDVKAASFTNRFYRVWSP